MAGHERFTPSEQHAPSELTVDRRAIDALRGSISEPRTVLSRRNGEEKLVTVRLVQEGSGQFGLTDMKDNREWSGIFNHSILTARYAIHFAEGMKQKGHETNPETILNSMIVSHAGRRSWDEAMWYPEDVVNGEKKRSVTNETLGLKLIHDKVGQDTFNLVAALGHNVEGFNVDPALYNSWDYKLAIYVDHRTTQLYEPLHTRMGGFLLNNFFDKKNITPETTEKVYTGMKSIINWQENHVLGQTGAESVSVREADHIAASLGAQPDSPRLSRKEFMRLLLQDATTGAKLLQAGINPDKVTDQTVPMPDWEDKLRKEYVLAARAEINLTLSVLQTQSARGNELASHRLKKDFPPNHWWTKYAKDLHREETKKIKPQETTIFTHPKYF